MISCAFSGSGTKAPVFVGAVKACMDAKESFGELAGTSGGSIVASILATNKNAFPVLTQLVDTDWTKFFPTGFLPFMFGGGLWNILFKGGLCDGKVFHQYMLDATHNMTFKDAMIDLKIIATNIDGGVSVFSKETPDVLIADAVRASMSIPFAFVPAQINGSYYIDGGIEDNIPADQLFSGNRKVGVRVDYHLAPLHGMVSDLSYAEQIIALLMKSTTDAHAKLGSLNGATILDIDTSYASGFDFKMDETMKSRLYDDGYSSMRIFLRGLK